MPRLTVEEYATLSTELASLANKRPEQVQDAVTRRLGQARLSADDWDAEMTYWEAELSAATEHEDQLPNVLVAYSSAVQAAQERLSSSGVSLERFAELLAAVRHGAPLDQLLKRYQLTLEDFLTAQRRWLAAASSDPEVRRVLDAAFRPAPDR
jgi:hypothetical protein